MVVRRLSAILLSLALAAVPVAARPLAPGGTGGAAATDERVFTGTLTHADQEQYREVPFDVPEGATRISIRFTYDGKAQKSVIDLGMLDPQRFRGWGGGSHPDFTLAVEDASPGFLPGPLPAGRWRLLLGVPNLRSGATAHYEARIAVERAPAAPVEFADAPLRAAPGWYRGDLHSHTGNSDGRCANQSGVRVPCPVDRTLAAAAARGLDFIAVTDHNTTAHFAALRALQPAYDQLLLVPGREITTFWGHANVFGLTNFLDFRTATGDAAAAGWLDAARAAGGVVSINHPAAPSGEICMGCGWRIDGLAPGAVQAIEVVNGSTMAETGSAEGTLQGFAFWQARLNTGERLTAIGGSDNHDAGRALDQVGAIGSPTTVIHMAELSVKGLLDGLRAGRVFIDVDGTRTRLLDMTARAGRHEVAMGGALPLGKGDAADFAVTVKGIEQGRLVVIIDGREEPALGRDIAGPAGHDAQLPFRWTADGRRHWIRADIRNADGRLLLVGNPIYIDVARN
ncbi:CehA/McbA family metallohydrolase [Sphingobium aquiterrae]|uniref:CehA/McbA family metallohydrolase n=1 Tax=Sphingobium aquiterrae TaxID=2038656 RepID=UPI00301956B3